MSSQRRLITEEVLSAAADWFLLNKRNEVKWECTHEGKKPHLFFTTDPKKAKQIINLLNEN
ncbi:hypothetical protein [Listeria valentina]|uniref:hypothetical protein n=1 Tax=Listeria valentina TaxID=2705293 RepID=UPI0014315673|nr:hypothetical protein [Listeria valentina]